jgi:hypothetical protein
MFANAKAIAAPTPKKAKSSKLELQVNGLEELAMVDAFQKTLDAIRVTLERNVKGQALAHFVAQIERTGQRPESFRGIDGGASASLELRKRSSNLSLNDEQIALLAEHGIEPHCEVIVPALYGINPAYAEDATLLSQVEAALSGIVPADFIVRQEERAKFTVTDDMLAAACAKKVPTEVLAVLTVLGCKPKLQLTNMARIMEFVRSLLTEPIFGDASNEAVAQTNKKVA